MTSPVQPRHVLVVLLLIAIACGPGAREKTLRSAMINLDTARTAFVVLDRAAQAVIVETAPSLEVGQRRLAEHRANRQAVVDAFEVAYRAVALASLNKDVSVVEVLTAVNALYVAVERFRASASIPDGPDGD